MTIERIRVFQSTVVCPDSIFSCRCLLLGVEGFNTAGSSCSSTARERGVGGREEGRDRACSCLAGLLLG